MKINSLFRQFIIQSIVSFLITGTLLSLFIYRSIVAQEIEHNIEIVTLTLGHSLEHWFESVDINHLSSFDIEHLDEEFDSLSELGNIADIRIWNTHRELVYSQDKSLIGSLKLNLDHFEKAQDNLTVYEFTADTAKENIMFQNLGNEFIAIYLPTQLSHL